MFKKRRSRNKLEQSGGLQVAAAALPPGAPPGSTPPILALFPRGARRCSLLLVDFTNPNILYAGTARIGRCAGSDISSSKAPMAGANWTNSITPPNSGCEFGDRGG